MPNDINSIQDWKLNGTDSCVSLVANSNRVKAVCDAISEFPVSIILNGIFVSVLFPGQSKSLASNCGDQVEFRTGLSAKPNQQTKGYLQ